MKCESVEGRKASCAIKRLISAKGLTYPYWRFEHKDLRKEIRGAILLASAFESQLKENVNRLKRQRKLWKPVRVAIDWTDEMFYGDHENTPMVNGTKPKNGSSYAFQFLTVCILVDGERLVVGVLPLESRNELPEHTLRAIEKVRELEVKIRNVTIDSGFFSAEMISCLQKEFERNKLRYIIRMPITARQRR